MDYLKVALLGILPLAQQSEAQQNEHHPRISNFVGKNYDYL